jgi:glutathione S-transferase
MADAAAPDMKLYYSPGASSLAPHIALREADRGFDLERVDLRTHRIADRDFHEINPKGDVPALELNGSGGELLTEVPAVVQYVADLAPERHLAPPSGTFARYHLQEWLAFIAGELDDQLSWLFEPDTPPHTQQRVRARVADRFRYLSDVLVDRGYLMGETFTVADAYLYTVLRRCERFGIDLVIWPNIDAYFQRIDERDAVQTALVAEGLIEKRARRIA